MSLLLDCRWVKKAEQSCSRAAHRGQARLKHGCMQQPDNVKQEARAAVVKTQDVEILLCFWGSGRWYLDCLREALATPLRCLAATLIASSASCTLLQRCCVERLNFLISETTLSTDASSPARLAAVRAAFKVLPSAAWTFIVSASSCTFNSNSLHRTMALDFRPVAPLPFGSAAHTPCVLEACSHLSALLLGLIGGHGHLLAHSNVLVALSGPSLCCCSDEQRAGSQEHYLSRTPSSAICLTELPRR